MSDWSAWVAAKGAAVLAWYRLGEANSTGGAVDASGNGRTLTYRTSSITYGNAGSAVGDSDTSVSVVGLSTTSTSYIAHGASGSYLNGLGTATFIAAVKIVSGNSPAFLLTSFDAASGTSSRGFIDTSGGVARCSFYTSGGTPHAITGTTAIDDNNWRLIFGVFDGTAGNVDLYIGKTDGSVIHDGTASVTAGSVIQTPSPDRGVTVGGRSTGTNYSAFQGFAMDEGLILNVALSPADVADAVAAWAATQRAGAAMTTVSTLGASGTYERPGAASLATVSTLVATAVGEFLGSAALSTVSTLAADGSDDQVGAAVLVAVASLFPVAGESGASGLVTTGTLAVDGLRETSGAVDMTTVSTLVAGGVREKPSAVAFACAATLVAAGESGGSAAATFVTVSTLTTTASINTQEIIGTASIITVGVDSGDTPTFETMELVIADPDQRRAPTSLEIILSGAESGEDVDFTLDGSGTVVWTLQTDSNGSIFLGSVDIPAEVDSTSIDAGTHTLHATAASGKVASDTFTLDLNPSDYPQVQAADVDPVEVPGRGNRWALQDPMPGGLGSWIMAPSPSSMSEPHLSKLVTVDHSTNPMDGRYHIEVADLGVKEWSFSGFCPDQTFYETLASYAELNRRFYVIDHRGRAWKVTFTKFDPKLRKRLINDDGTPQDWAADYTVTATIYDTDPLEPVTL